MAGRILIFDEDVHTRLTIARVFAQRGFIIIETTNVVDVVECTERLEPACVFLAGDSPENDGIALLRLLRETHPDVPVVIVADHFDGPIAHQARLYGARCCLQRPISCAAIEQLLTELCSAQDHAAGARSSSLR